MIIVGWFEEFEERNINAFYDSGAVYISNLQDDQEDMFDDIVHEIAHSVEDAYVPSALPSHVHPKMAVLNRQPPKAALDIKSAGKGTVVVISNIQASSKDGDTVTPNYEVESFFLTVN